MQDAGAPMLDLKKPTISDVADMVRLMAPHIHAERLLPRSPRQVVERLREYWVARAGDELVGVASLALVDFGLALLYGPAYYVLPSA